MLALCRGTWALSSCGEGCPGSVAAHGLRTMAVSLLQEHGALERRFSSCGSEAEMPLGVWNLSGPGMEPEFPVLAGRCSTPGPPGKSQWSRFLKAPVPQRTEFTVAPGVSLDPDEARCFAPWPPCHLRPFPLCLFCLLVPDFHCSRCPASKLFL